MLSPPVDDILASDLLPRIHARSKRVDTIRHRHVRAIISIILTCFQRQSRRKAKSKSIGRKTTPSSNLNPTTSLSSTVSAFSGIKWKSHAAAPFVSNLNALPHATARDTQLHAKEKAEAKRLAKGKAAAKADIQEVIDATSLHIQLRYTLLPVNLPQDNHPEDPEAPFDPQNIPGREIIADTGGYYIHQRFAKDEDTLKQYHNGNSWISSSEIPTTWSSITSAHATPPQPAAALP
ncbi:hypothetical protein Vi05172_g10865 [Venturia inaequalis]|nr:hypothetical protein Vi05172_g10865 [Venturia inaequalis]